MNQKALNTAIALALATLAAAPSQATEISNVFTFQTSEQSLWASGAQASWAYDSGFIGGTWGGGAGASSPVEFGINGITGDAHALLFPAIPSLQLTPYVPAVTTPAVPPKLITAAIPPQVVTPAVPSKLITAAIPSKQLTPAVNATYSPAVGATYAPRVCVKIPFAGTECTGGQQITPAIPSKQLTPYIPATYSPAVPAVYSVAIPAITTPAVPATYSAAVPAVYGDTRTGGSGSVKTSGALGFNVTAGANGGGVAVTLPYQTTLVLPDKFVAGQLLRVGGSGNIAAGASIAVDAPSFNAAVNGIIHTSTTLSGKGCFVGAGCSESGAKATINQTFEIVSFDTARSPAAQAINGLVPLPVKLGEDLPITVGAQTVGHVTINAPSDKAGGTVAGKTLSLNTSDTLLRTTADFGGIAQVALGVPGDVLQPAVEIPQAITIGGTVVNLQGGVKLGLSQHLAFVANVDVTLNFDQIAYDSQGVALGQSVTFDIGSGLDIQFKQQPGHLSYSFSMGADSLLSNDTGLSVDPLFAIKAGCFNLSVAGGALADVSQCAFDHEYATTDLVRATVYAKSFALQGFNEATYSVDLAPVPEPQTCALLLAGLGMVGALTRRRAARG